MGEEAGERSSGVGMEGKNEKEKREGALLRASERDDVFLQTSFHRPTQPASQPTNNNPHQIT